MVDNPASCGQHNRRSSSSILLVRKIGPFFFLLPSVSSLSSASTNIRRGALAKYRGEDLTKIHFAATTTYKHKHTRPPLTLPCSYHRWGSRGGKKGSTPRRTSNTSYFFFFFVIHPFYLPAQPTGAHHRSSRRWYDFALDF